MLLRFAGLCVFVFNEQEHAAQIARTGDGERCVCGAQPALRRQNGVLAGGDECLYEQTFIKVVFFCKLGKGST